MSMSLTKSFSLSLNDCKDPGERQTEPSPIFSYEKVTFHSFLVSSSLSDVSPVDMLSVSSPRDEVCARVLVRIGDQAEVKIEHH